jgi:hypothetical protein
MAQDRIEDYWAARAATLDAMETLGAHPDCVFTLAGMLEVVLEAVVFAAPDHGACDKMISLALHHARAENTPKED